MPEPNQNQPSSSADLLIVKTACDSIEEARRLAELLLNHGLGAAVQISSIESLYWWEGDLCEKEEWELSCMTRAELYPRVEELILAEHSYRVPEIIAVPIAAVSDSWAGWVREYT